MIFGAKQQNESLRKAGGTPKDTSYRKENAQKYSAKILSDKNNKPQETGGPKLSSKSGGSDKIKGSYEGLMHSSSTVINTNGRGYDAKSAQTARYNKDFISHNNHNFRFDNSMSDKNYSIMNNNSFSSKKDSSSFKLNNIVKNNMMFK